MALYHDLLMDHYHNPRNKGCLVHTHFKVQEYNPSCGDCITMEGTLSETILTDIRFSGTGCIISQATASLLTQFCMEKTIDEVLAFDAKTMQNLITVDLGPLRLKCALLSLHALQNGLYEYTTKK